MSKTGQERKEKFKELGISGELAGRLSSVGTVRGQANQIQKELGGIDPSVIGKRNRAYRQTGRAIKQAAGLVSAGLAATEGEGQTKGLASAAREVADFYIEKAERDRPVETGFIQWSRTRSQGRELFLEREVVRRFGLKRGVLTPDGRIRRDADTEARRAYGAVGNSLDLDFSGDKIDIDVDRRFQEEVENIVFDLIGTTVEELRAQSKGNTTIVNHNEGMVVNQNKSQEEIKNNNMTRGE